MYLIRHLFVYNFKFFPHKPSRKYCCNSVRYGSRIHNTVNSHENRKDNQQRQQKNNLSCKRKKHAFSRFSDRCKGICSNRLYSVNKGEKQINTEKFLCKSKIFFASRTENRDNFSRKNLKQKKRCRGNKNGRRERFFISFFYSFSVSRIVVQLSRQKSKVFIMN